MPVYSDTLALPKTHELQILNITGDIAQSILRSKINDGIVTVFNVGSTGAITTIEFEPGLQKDFPDMLDRIAPASIPYQHDLTWHDGNGHSHCRASLLGPDITIPFVNQQMTLGTWQQVVFIELDNKPHHRKLAVQVIGE